MGGQKLTELLFTSKMVFPNCITSICFSHLDKIPVVIDSLKIQQGEKQNRQMEENTRNGTIRFAADCEGPDEIPFRTLLPEGGGLLCEVRDLRPGLFQLGP